MSKEKNPDNVILVPEERWTQNTPTTTQRKLRMMAHKPELEVVPQLELPKRIDHYTRAMDLIDKLEAIMDRESQSLSLKQKVTRAFNPQGLAELRRLQAVLKSNEVFMLK